MSTLERAPRPVPEGIREALSRIAVKREEAEVKRLSGEDTRSGGFNGAATAEPKPAACEPVWVGKKETPPPAVGPYAGGGRRHTGEVVKARPLPDIGGDPNPAA